MRNSVRYGIGILIAANALGAIFFFPINQWVLNLVAWIQSVGVSGVIVYVLTYIIATLLLLPGSILTLGAGFAYGPIWGTLLVSPVSVLASVLSFLFGRSIARNWVSHKIKHDPRFSRIDHAIAYNGFKIVFLLRLSPVIPYNILNYALGLTQVRLHDYVAASFLGMLPGTMLYVYLGSLVTNASELMSKKPSAISAWNQILYWGGLAATLIVTVLITRTARHALTREMEHTRPTESLSNHTIQP